MAIGSPNSVSKQSRAQIAPNGRQFGLDLFFDSVPVPMLVLDSKGRVCRSNRAARDVLVGLAGRTTGMGLGMAVRCVHSAEHPDGCGASSSCEDCPLHGLVNRTVATGRTHRQVEAKVAVQRGSTQSDSYLLLSTAVADLPEGRRVLVCVEDITARKQAELELRQALQEVEQLKEQLQLENLCLRQEIKQAHVFEEIVGTSAPLQHTLESIEHVASTGASVLILGETGTGKELIARAIHSRSSRKDRPLVTINCAAVPGSLMESELFGYAAGAFTGALADKAGRFELADRGTIFLDEIGELPLELQAKLLRVLENGQFWVLGSTMKTVDVRVIAATNRDLRHAIADGSFRSDLYYRLAVFPIEVPPLRARRSDIPLLAAHFIAKKQAELGKKFEHISDAMMEALVEYDWPGNVRELENVIERAMILSPTPVLQLDACLTSSVKLHQPHVSRNDLESVDRAHILQVLQDCRWRIKGPGNAAERLGLKSSTLRSRMKKLGIARP